MRLLETVFPSRLGIPFRWLVGSTWVSNIGDGIALAAGPLLIASQTHNPTLVAMAALLQRLPWLLFGLHAGVVADRLDRRRLVMVADAARMVVVLALAFTLLTGTVSIALILVVMFLLGTAETFADTATPAILPMLLDKRDLGVGNARIFSGFLVANQMVGPPIGAALFALGRAWPFLTQGLCVALGVLLVSRVSLPPHGRAVRNGDVPPPVHREIGEGLAWVWHNKAVRTLALTIVSFNVTWGCAWSVLVLYAHDRLGLGEIGFGLITTTIAVGGLVGTGSYGWLERRVSLAWLMRGVLLVETLVHLVLALTHSPTVAMVAFFAFGAEAFVWGTTSSAVRQRAVPLSVQGRVSSVYLLGVMGGLVVGAALAGPLAHVWGITAPFWFAFAGSAVILALLWRQLGYVAHADEQILHASADPDPAPR